MKRTRKPLIMLFDLDGVMINPLGYRHAFFESARYFFLQMGLENPIELAGVPEIFEAN